MSIAQVGGAGSPTVIYAKNDSGTTLSVGSVVMEKVVDGAGDGYKWVLPDIDTAPPESLYARRGVVYAADSAATFADGADIALVVEGYVSEVLVDASSPISVGDLLISQDASARLIKAAAGSIDLIVDNLTATVISAAAAADGANDVITDDVPDDNAGAVASSATLTELAAPTAYDVTHVIHATTLLPGDIVDIFASGRIVAVNGTDNHTFALRFDGDVVVSLDSAAPVTGIWQIHARVQVRTPTTYVAAGFGYQGTEETFPADAVNPVLFGHIVETAFATSSSSTIDVLLTHQQNSASNQDTLDILQVNIIRPTLGVATLLNEVKADYNLLRGTVGELITEITEIRLDYTRLLADVTALHGNVTTLVDKTKVVAIAHEASSSATGSIAATIIKR